MNDFLFLAGMLTAGRVRAKRSWIASMKKCRDVQDPLVVWDGTGLAVHATTTDMVAATTTTVVAMEEAGMVGGTMEAAVATTRIHAIVPTAEMATVAAGHANFMGGAEIAHAAMTTTTAIEAAEVAGTDTGATAVIGATHKNGVVTVIRLRGVIVTGVKGITT